MNQKNTKNAALLSGVTLGLLTLAGCGNDSTPAAVPANPSSETAPFAQENPAALGATTTAPAAPSTSTAPTAKGTYKNGTYTVVGTYKSPAGPEEIGVTVVLKNDVITSSDVVVKATAIKSVNLQKDFAANYKPMVIGKNIDTLSLGKVSGASLTPMGFNDALAKIKSQAK